MIRHVDGVKAKCFFGGLNVKVVVLTKQEIRM